MEIRVIIKQGNGKEVELSRDELRKLYDFLKDIFEYKKYEWIPYDDRPLGPSPWTTTGGTDKIGWDDSYTVVFTPYEGFLDAEEAT